MKSLFLAASTVIFAALMLAACTGDVDCDCDTAAGAATYDAELSAVSTLIDIWDTADTDRLDAIAHANYERSAPDANASSLDELKAFMMQVHETYPDYRISNDGMAAGPDGVFVQWTVTGTDSGPGEEATGKALRVTGMSRYSFRDGRIASERVIYDTGSVLSQLETSQMPHTN